MASAAPKLTEQQVQAVMQALDAGFTAEQIVSIARHGADG